MKSLLSSNKVRLFEAFFWTYCVFAILRLLWYLKTFFCDLSSASGVKTYGISDWLINYESGFVRRGLFGQILYSAYDQFHINPLYALYAVACISCLLYIIIFVSEWRRHGLSFALLPTVFILGLPSIYGLRDLRRDLLIFLIAYATFICYRKLLSGNRMGGVLMVVFLTVAVLLHEASFFYLIPLLMLHWFLRHARTVGYVRATVTTFVWFAIPLVAVVVCALFKGDAQQAAAIWHSWDSVFMSNCGSIPNVGEGVAALGWETLNTFKFHLSNNFLMPVLGIPSFLLWPWIFVGIYFLLTMPNRLEIGVNSPQKEFSVLGFSHVLLLEFVFLLPMFTLFSCDYTRVLSYCIITSFLFCFSMDCNELSVLYYPRITSSIARVNQWLHKGILSRRWVYLLIWLTIGVPLWTFTLEEYCRSTILFSPLCEVYKLLLRLL